MAIIYSYPLISTIGSSDLFPLTATNEDNELYTANVTMSTLAVGVMGEAFNGTDNYIPLFDGTNPLVDSVLSQESGESPTWVKTDPFVKLGVGTLNVPESQLHVRKSGGGEAIRVENGNIGFYNGTTKHSYIGKETNTDTNLVLETSTAVGGIIFNTQGTNERVRINANGNVGIGTSPDFGRKLDVNGDLQTRENIYVGKAGTNKSAFNVEIGQGRSGNGYAILDLTGDTTYTDYGLRLIRGNTGPDASSQIKHRGSGLFSVIAEDNADISLIGGDVGIGTTTPNEKLDVNGNVKADKFLVDGLNTAPSTATSPGTTGDIRFTADYIYVCVATNTWKRVAISSF